MSGHTKGPWVAALDKNNRPIVWGPGTWQIADGWHTPDGMGWGNARLIAAAPELLAALEMAVGTVEHMYHTNPDPDGSLWADVLACRAAIRKATEGQP